eukprot:TRINITY_DN7480_c0_g1_i1.p1 TRINITY_DN7480_c0_g1~~TRINITY_DN7480_c0_g1_i1.p1  ORF type:complete len:287 (-),score=58.02 TRINITY_DN7480_c0_g1_i1:321-1181(-)
MFCNLQWCVDRFSAKAGDSASDIFGVEVVQDVSGATYAPAKTHVAGEATALVPDVAVPETATPDTAVPGVPDAPPPVPGADVAGGVDIPYRSRFLIALYDEYVKNKKGVVSAFYTGAPPVPAEVRPIFDPLEERVVASNEAEKTIEKIAGELGVRWRGGSKAAKKAGKADLTTGTASPPAPVTGVVSGDPDDVRLRQQFIDALYAEYCVRKPKDITCSMILERLDDPKVKEEWQKYEEKVKGAEMKNAEVAMLSRDWGTKSPLPGPLALAELFNGDCDCGEEGCEG